MIQDNFQFKVLCFIVRGLEAIGASAFSTSSFVYVIQLFPENVSSVLVSFNRTIIFYFFEKCSMNHDVLVPISFLTIFFFKGILETFVGLGMSVGPAIGGLLSSVSNKYSNL